MAVVGRVLSAFGVFGELRRSVSPTVCYTRRAGIFGLFVAHGQRPRNRRRRPNGRSQRTVFTFSCASDVPPPETNCMTPLHGPAWPTTALFDDTQTPRAYGIARSSRRTLGTRRENSVYYTRSQSSSRRGAIDNNKVNAAAVEGRCAVTLGVVSRSPRIRDYHYCCYPP